MIPLRKYSARVHSAIQLETKNATTFKGDTVVYADKRFCQHNECDTTNTATLKHTKIVIKVDCSVPSDLDKSHLFCRNPYKHRNQVRMHSATQQSLNQTLHLLRLL